MPSKPVSAMPRGLKRASIAEGAKALDHLLRQTHQTGVAMPPIV
jgi:hypothetical protein